MNDDKRNPNEKAVAWYVEQTERLLEDQQRRVESLRTRGGQLATFSGAVLALVGANASRMMEAIDGNAEVAVGIAILIGISLLTIAVVVALVWGFRPTMFTAISADEIGNYLTPRFIDEPDLWRVHVRTIRALKGATEVAQERGERAANALKLALYLFLGGLAATYLAIAILVLELLS